MERRPLSPEDIRQQSYLPTAFDITSPEWSSLYPWWDREWTEWEEIMPKGGFIEKFVLATKGTETTTSFAMWTALSCVASVLARDAYLALYPSFWYPNLYVILTAPPGLAKKSTVQGLSKKLLREFHHHIEDENLRWKKEANIHTNRVTPEGMQDLLLPSVPRPPITADIPEEIFIDRGSRLTLIISELATFLGRQSYNLGLVSKLTDLYDCGEFDVDYTKKDGKQSLRNIYVNFLGATTPGDLHDVIPQEAFGGGLMSRTIVVYENDTVRYHPFPMRIESGPTMEDLEKGLAWIATNGFHPYTLSRDALAYYYRWYEGFKKSLRQSDSIRVLSAARMDVLLMKLALLIRAQRYEPGQVIERDDITKAEQILKKTYFQNEDAVESVGATDRGKEYIRIRNYLERHGSALRKFVLQHNSRYLSSDELSSILSQLHEVGAIEVWYEGKLRKEISRHGEEEYVWKGDNNES